MALGDELPGAVVTIANCSQHAVMRAADALAQLAREHGLAPWLHQRARQQALAFVPSLAATLATEYRASLARNAVRKASSRAARRHWLVRGA